MLPQQAEEGDRAAREAFTVQVWKLSARVLLTSQWPDADAWLPLAARKAGKGYLTECPRRRGHGLEEEPARLREPRTSSKERWPGQEVIHLQHIVPNEELALAGLQERASPIIKSQLLLSKRKSLGKRGILHLPLISPAT